MMISCKRKLIDLSTPRVMGILNITPDSFYEGSRLKNADEALKKTEQMLNEGADFLDVGGMSTRPGSEILSETDELNRVIPIIEIILKNFPETLISVDTWRSKVALEAVGAGAAIVNDISAGSLDSELFQTVAKLDVPYILMHMQGTPQTMQQNPVYKDVVLEVNQFLSEKIFELRKLGVSDIILDPGFGFGKTIDHNYRLLKNLNLIGFGEFPILAGLSRKSMIKKLLDVDEKNALNGTTAVNMIALQNGANILRMHDVKEAKQCVQIWQELKNSD
ncbi:MAG: dihydropteroate synthase [Flavobacteriia bacterium]|nr:dihydropteroate synthase [Flavobacteriia bacterium]